MAGRRGFVITLGAGVLGWVDAVRAQTKQPVMIGWLGAGSRTATMNRLVAFKDGMAALGWREGAHYLFEERWAESRLERLDALARELAEKKPAVIVTSPIASTIAAAKASPRTPIVQATGSDPVAAGLAASLARPRGTVTGVTNVITDLTEKYLELLLAAAPELRRVGFLADPSAPAHVYAETIKAAGRSAAKYDIKTTIQEARNPDDLELAIARLAKARVQALVILPSNIFTPQRDRVLKLAAPHRWPIISGSHEYSENGALLTYGPDREALYRRAAWYVDKILKGAKPGDLPIEQPTRFELVVNLKTAKALGLTIPQPFLMRADRVIE